MMNSHAIVLSFLPIAWNIVTGAGLETCPVKVEKIGCFRDTLNPRPLPIQLINDRDPSSKVFSGILIDWYHMEKYLMDFSCRCAKAAKAHGYTHYGLQFYGECWSGLLGEAQFGMYGPSDNCLMKLTFPITPCNRTSPLDCVGGPETNYIYRIGDVRETVDGKWSPWGPWTKCSKSCGTGFKSRERTCTNPVPENGGKKCKGPAEQSTECNMGKCPTPCRHDIDLGIALDSSGSIGHSVYDVAKDFLVKLVANTQGAFKDSKFGIIVYNHEPNLLMRFSQNSSQTLGHVTHLIWDMAYMRKGTRTDKALQLAAEELYSARGGDRRGVANVLLVITDGRTSRLSSPYQDVLAPLKARDVHVIAIGVGDAVKEPELLQIAMETKNHVFTVNDYIDLHQKLSDIVDRVCEAGANQLQ
ncbi:coadhesin isoform X2 [Nematostella vectensis]|uniref:coadhesin isoform X2 n=1 Tax=Nematostella vectensis TaxID=45351 RepID=UPI002076FD98|nr:coadhesin isoform X2 [Nematostella vectensis]